MKYDYPVFDDCKNGLEKAKENMLKVEESEKNGENKNKCVCVYLSLLFSVL